jgi:hypothetical protein
MNRWIKKVNRTTTNATSNNFQNQSRYLIIVQSAGTNKIFKPFKKKIKKNKKIMKQKGPINISLKLIMILVILVK